MPCVAGSHKGQLQVSVDRSADLKVHFIGRPFLHRQAFLLQLDIPVRGSGIGDLISRLAALKQCFRLRRAVYVMAPVFLARREVSVLDQFRSDISRRNLFTRSVSVLHFYDTDVIDLNSGYRCVHKLLSGLDLTHGDHKSNVIVGFLIHSEFISCLFHFARIQAQVLTAVPVVCRCQEGILHDSCRGRFQLHGHFIFSALLQCQPCLFQLDIPVLCAHIGDMVRRLLVRKTYRCLTRRRYGILPFGPALCKITVFDQVFACFYRRLLLGLRLFQCDIVDHNRMFCLNTSSTYRTHGNAEYGSGICILRHLKYMTEILIVSCQTDLLRTGIRNPVVITRTVSLQRIHDLSVLCRFRVKGDLIPLVFFQLDVVLFQLDLPILIRGIRYIDGKCILLIQAVYDIAGHFGIVGHIHFITDQTVGEISVHDHAVFPDADIVDICGAGCP